MPRTGAGRGRRGRGRRGKGEPPLALRLVRLSDNGRGVCLLTDVADPGRLGDEAAGALYRMRWGVELFCRAAKQTLGRRKVRSAAPDQAKPAEPELAWSVVGLMLPGLMAVQRVIAADRDPLGWSAAAALRAVRRAVRRAARTPAARPVRRRPSNWPGQSRTATSGLAARRPATGPARRTTSPRASRSCATPPPRKSLWQRRPE